jgi:hypothetical protein
MRRRVVAADTLPVGDVFASTGFLFARSSSTEIFSSMFRTPPDMREHRTCRRIRASENLNTAALRPLAILRQPYKINVAS